MEGLVLNQISKQFGKKKALDQVSCRFDHGITALLGPNGAGKSTLMNIVCTLLPADSGTVTYDGTPILDMKKSYLERLSMLFQNQPMYRGDTAMEYLQFTGVLKGVSARQVEAQGSELLQRFGIADTGKKKISAFSGGMRQRLALCGAFLGQPEILMLDEPSAGLDIYEREELKRYLCTLKQDRTVIISTHIVSDIENIADRIILLNEGKVHACGTQEELIRGLAGRVWQIPEDADVSGHVYYSDGRRLAIADEKPCADAVSKEADLTDVYFSCVKVR